MIEFLKGRVHSTDRGYLVLETNGIGYIINMVSRELHTFYKNEEVFINIRLILREDAAILYGFKDSETRNAFDLLTSVTGIGPKLAMGILDGDDVSNIAKYILSKDEKSLTKLPGVGKKTAQRIILELKDKVEKLNLDLDFTKEESPLFDENDDPAVEALISLGYNVYDAKKSLEKVDASLDISERIREALKLMG
ncbi:Holliday junction branch migration protein RuvA [uncultured Peptoniphilus sp.]|uniref:Holliday junction branch migration protein RuvA n=1 Tax=uncultured Peptoniphilus sp. TaxID=254354 RepID=UPI001DC638E9|nr:Holliday junction branch migration protein RuvA [uncultured Peptoniphilus sp.]MBS4882856.1 Holliday junction branch migration protein RuvA [Peptoniphilus harei]MDU3010852.1 Holliday junction branch migration protein RuvA [Peptoniphilus harei]MDU5569826.1 Holliday junction branch migration protein RuvA [Peptoniphilus harei]MDU6782976.1 Holliday junction branch migration protein RuvA [Peptoniphilus harei]